MEINKKLVENVEYINSGRLYISDVNLNFGDKVRIAVQSNSSTAKILSRSESIEYEILGVENMIQNSVIALESIDPLRNLIRTNPAAAQSVLN